MDATAYLYNDKTIQPWKHPPVPCTEIQINKSLNLLGIRSWDELEPVNGEGGDIIYIKDKLDKALKGKLSRIDKQCQRETVEIWRVNMTAKRLEKETYERKIQEEAAVKQRAKTAMRQKVELHEAYQLLLQEHHIRVKRRARQKLLAIGLMKNSAVITSKPEDSIMQEKNDLNHAESHGTNFQANSENKIEEPQSFNIIKRPKSSTSLTKTNSITSERSSRNETRYSSPLPRSKSAASLSNSSYRKRTKKFQRSNTPTRAYKRSNYTDHHIGYF